VIKKRKRTLTNMREAMPSSALVTNKEQKKATVSLEFYFTSIFSVLTSPFSKPIIQNKTPR